MRKNILPPILAILWGGVGFALRRWQLATAFEPDTGLPIPGVPATMALLVWSVLLIPALVLLCRGLGPARSWEEALDAQGSSLFLTAVVTGAFLLLVSAGAEAITLSATYRTSLSLLADGETLGWTAAVMPPLRIALCAAGFPCALAWGQRVARKSPKVRESLALLELCLLFCVWLVSDYQVRAANPVTQDYLYTIFAIVCGLLGLYYIAGWSFQSGKLRRTVVFCLLGPYFSLVTLADHHSLAEVTRFAFVILFLAAHAVLFLNPPPAGENDEATPNQALTEEVPQDE